MALGLQLQTQLKPQFKAKIMALGLQLQTQLKPQFKAVSLIKVCVIWKSVIIILNEIPFVYVQEK